MSRAKVLFVQIGECMREWRRESGVTLNEAAYLLKWKPERLEAFGAGGEISAQELKKFASVFLIDREELLDTIFETFLERFSEE